MSSILEDLASQIGGANLSQLAEAIGADKGSVEKAVAGALPILMGALAHNARDSGGVGSLLGALDRDHDGSLLDDLGGFFGGGDTHGGADILGHVLGGGRSNAERTVSKMSGLDGRQVGSLLAMLAPVVMGYLGRMQRQQHLDTAGLANALGHEQRVLEKANPQAMDVITSMLDRNHDGDLTDDLMSIGGKLFSEFMKS